MNIDQWAESAPNAGPADGETPEEYEARITALRKLSAENAVAHPWSHHRRRKPDSPTPERATT